MEANTVILNLGDYNSLRDFKEGMEKGYTYYVEDHSIYYGSTISYRFVSTDGAVKMLSEMNQNLTTRISDLQNEICNLNNPEKEVTIEQIKKMSLWEFLKWRRKNKK